MKDMLGTEVKAGDYIAYAKRCGNTAEQSIYLVKEAGEDFVKVMQIPDSTLVLCSNGNLVPKYLTYHQRSLTCKDGVSVEMDEAVKYETIKNWNRISTLRQSNQMLVLKNWS